MDRHRPRAQLITEDIPTASPLTRRIRTPKRNSEKQNAHIEHDKALARVMIAVLKDDTELFKQCMDNESFQPLADAYRLRDHLRPADHLNAGVSTGTALP